MTRSGQPGQVPQCPGRYAPRVSASVALTLAIALCSALLVGCAKKDKIVGPGERFFLYPKLSSPFNVLAALETAYECRDSVEFKLLYDSLYVGRTFDQRDPGNPGQYTFNKADEVRHVASLAKNPSVTIDLTYPPVLTRVTDLSDPPGWATIQTSGLRLEIDDGSIATSYFIASDRETMEFKFIPTSPDSTSPTDTTWKIVRWSEVAN